MGRSKDDGIAPQAYAYYRMPQANTYNCVKQYSSPTKIASLYEISDDKSGFLIAPFDVLHEDTYLIQPDNIITESIEELYNEYRETANKIKNKLFRILVLIIILSFQ